MLALFFCTVGFTAATGFDAVGFIFGSLGSVLVSDLGLSLSLLGSRLSTSTENKIHVVVNRVTLQHRI